MPTAALKPCAAVGCGALVQRGRCDKHASQQSRSRGTTKERGYGSDWERCRDAFLAQPENQVCALKIVCAGSVATEVDHRIPFRGLDDPLRLDWSNMQPACKPCNSAKAHRADN